MIALAELDELAAITEKELATQYEKGFVDGKKREEDMYNSGYRSGVESIKHELVPQEKAYERGYDHGLAAGIAKVEAATNYPDVAEDYRRGYTEGSTEASKNMLHLIENPVKTTFYIEKDFKLRPIAEAPKDGSIFVAYANIGGFEMRPFLAYYNEAHGIFLTAARDSSLPGNTTHFIEIPQSIENISNSPIIDRETLLHSQPANDSTLHFRSDNSKTTKE